MGQNVDNFLYLYFLGRTSQKYHPVLKANKNKSYLKKKINVHVVKFSAGFAKKV